MYKHNIEKFGRFERHIFFSPSGKNSFSIVPEQGAVLMDTFFNEINVIEGFSTPEELEDFKWAKSAVLYPFPNRMCDGTYTHEGKTYHFPIDNAATNNAIHGFGKKMPHHIVAIILSENYASVTCRNDYDGHLSYYPFPFSFEITFTISDDCKMEVSMSLENKGEDLIPVGIGWHPYFAISEKIEDTFLQLPDLQTIEIDERMLPTGKKKDYNRFLSLEKIGETSLDNGFFIPKKDKKIEVILESDKGKLTYWQETGEGKYNFIQIFTPPHRSCIALEPMTSNIDTFNNKDGLVLLKKGEKINGDFGFNFLSK
jgi:aldose 1-epimerase